MSLVTVPMSAVNTKVQYTTVSQNSFLITLLILTLLDIIMDINDKLTEKEFLYFIIYLKNPNY